VTDHDFQNRVDRCIVILTLHPVDSPRVLEAVNDLADLCNSLGLPAEAALEIATRIGTVARGLREVEMYSLAANLALQ
jgi:hypothetical protein